MKVGRRSAETYTCQCGDEGLAEELARRGDFNEQNALKECRRRRPLSDFVAVESQPPKYAAQTLWINCLNKSSLRICISVGKQYD